MDIRQRRTIRKYTQQPVSDELLNRLIEDASRTQTMGNLQLYSVVVTRSAAMKEMLAPAHFCQPMVTQAPVVLTICADFRRTSDWCLQRQASPGYDNALSFLNAATDALLFTQTFCCLAEEAGLGICFLGTTVYQPQAIIATLDLPELVFPVATLTVGWPAEHPDQTDRLPLQAIVHRETYSAFTPERIDACYSNRESLPENKHFVEVNNKETLAQVFTDVRYTRKDNEAMSEGLLAALTGQKFLREDALQGGTPKVVERRPDILECDVVRFQNNKERWVAFVGLLDGAPYEIFTGLQDDEEGIAIPKSVQKGFIVKHYDSDGQKHYDFQFVNKRGYKTTIEGLSERFNPKYWDYAKLISGVLRYRMPIDHVIRLISSLQLENDTINSWTAGVARVLKKYLPESITVDEEELESEK